MFLLISVFYCCLNASQMMGKMMTIVVVAVFHRNTCANNCGLYLLFLHLHMSVVYIVIVNGTYVIDRAIKKPCTEITIDSTF
jgi:hypothetical protein